MRPKKRAATKTPPARHLPRVVNSDAKTVVVRVEAGLRYPTAVYYFPCESVEEHEMDFPGTPDLAYYSPIRREWAWISRGSKVHESSYVWMSRRAFDNMMARHNTGSQFLAGEFSL